MQTILFLGGPSGVGKSHFASKFLASKKWLHFEIDQWQKDGIDECNLRHELNDFATKLKPDLLKRELLRRAASRQNIVLTFPSAAIFSPQHRAAAKGHFRIAYLFGHPRFCLQAFLAREEMNGRGLTANYWNSNNVRTFALLSLSHNHNLVIEAFKQDGSRRKSADILADILQKTD
jgi:adenylate kinase family enzyme